MNYYEEAERRRVMNQCAIDWHELPEDQKTGKAGAFHFLRIVEQRDARLKAIEWKYGYERGRGNRACPIRGLGE